MSLRRLFIVSAAILTGLTAMGTATAMSERPEASENRPRDPKKCFDPRFVRNFTTVDDKKMIVIAGNNDVYELTLWGSCFGLDSAFQIGIQSRGNLDVCSGFDATILYRDMGRVQRCTVSQVKALSAQEAQQYISPRRSDTPQDK